MYIVTAKRARDGYTAVVAASTNLEFSYKSARHLRSVFKKKTREDLHETGKASWGNRFVEVAVKDTTMDIVHLLPDWKKEEWTMKSLRGKDGVA